jgi:hypothetical protein
VFVIVAPLDCTAYDPRAPVSPGYPYAPPDAPACRSTPGERSTPPFGYRCGSSNPIERRYEEDRTRRATFAAGDPWFLLGQRRSSDGTCCRAC